MAYTTIDDPSAYFQTKLYTGGTAEAKTFDGNSNLKPDWFWSKKRGASQFHATADSSRGIANALRIDTTGAEYTNTEADDLASFDTNGFTFDGTGDTYNGTYQSSSYVAWCWAANGGTTTTNDASSTGVGTIDSVYQANTTAGFSIVTYSGSGSAGTIAHGLGVTPNWVIIKNRGPNTRGWIVYHDKSHGTPEENFTLLNTNAAVADLDRMNDTAPTSTVFSVSDDTHVNNGSDTYVAYCFAEKQGYSKFGSYTGNQSTDGPFLYFGFKPAFLMVKKTTSAENWFLIDNKRHPINDGQIPRVIPNNTDAESEDASIAGDFLSNGFKIRATQNMINESGTYIYMAFAESPFVSSEGVPTTAR